MNLGIEERGVRISLLIYVFFSLFRLLVKHSLYKNINTILCYVREDNGYV